MLDPEMDSLWDPWMDQQLDLELDRMLGQL